MVIIQISCSWFLLSWMAVITTKHASVVLCFGLFGFGDTFSPDILIGWSGGWGWGWWFFLELRVEKLSIVVTKLQCQDGVVGFSSVRKVGG